MSTKKTARVRCVFFFSFDERPVGVNACFGLLIVVVVVVVVFVVVVVVVVVLLLFCWYNRSDRAA